MKIFGVRRCSTLLSAVCGAVVLGVVCVSSPVFAQDAGDTGGQDAGALETTQDPFPLSSDQHGITIDFREASVEEAAKFYVAIVGIKYIVDESCEDSTITIQTEEPLPDVPKAVERFEEELEDAGYEVEELDEGRRITC